MTDVRRLGVSVAPTEPRDASSQPNNTSENFTAFVGIPDMSAAGCWET
jgi:hypothetical protein